MCGCYRDVLVVHGKEKVYLRFDSVRGSQLRGIFRY